MFIDSHAHVDGPEFDSNLGAVLERARDARVEFILNIGTGDPRAGVFERAVELGNTHENIYTAIGVHPHDASHYDDSTEKLIRQLIAKNKKVLAWGEIGLDFHYDNSPRDVQVKAFRRQLRAARECDLPVVIHTREAEAETIDALRDELSGSDRTGVFHCFSGSAQLAQQALELGFMISFSGIVTFKKADDLRAIAREVPLDRLLIETDCPYLAPVPYRGKQNEPAFVIEVARCLADLRETDVETIGRETATNFHRLFNI